MVVFGEDVRAGFPSSRREISFFLSVNARVRSGDLDRACFFEAQVGQTWIPPRWFAPRWNVGGFIGPGRGVDKIDEVSFVFAACVMRPSRVCSCIKRLSAPIMVESVLRSWWRDMVA